MESKDKSKKKKKFLNVPQYPGGKKAFEKFIRDNLKYPDEAKKNKIEGEVHLAFEVTYKGEVVNARVLHGIGYGCDEEALRLIRMIKYGVGKNRGVRLTAKKRVKIGFKLNKEKTSIKYEYHTKKSEKKSNEEKPVENKKPETYTYSIKF